MFSYSKATHYSLACSLVAFSMTPAASASAQPTDPSAQSPYVQTLPDGPGKAATLRLCNVCHDIEEVSVERLSKKGWEQKIDEMFRAGAKGTDEDVALALAYLAATFPARLNINKAITMDFQRYLTLSEGDGDRIVAYRRQHGPFKKWQDLERVPGIDLKKIRERCEILVVD
jgi:competence protein ComEA